jgi:hypothetical protein
MMVSISNAEHVEPERYLAVNFIRPIELLIEVVLGLWFLRHDERKPLLVEATRNTARLNRGVK